MQWLLRKLNILRKLTIRMEAEIQPENCPICGRFISYARGDLCFCTNCGYRDDCC